MSHTHPHVYTCDCNCLLCIYCIYMYMHDCLDFQRISFSILVYSFTALFPLPSLLCVPAGKIGVPLPRHFSQQQAQLLLLRQNTLQHNQPQPAGGGGVTTTPNPLPRLQTPQQQQVLGTQKVTLPAGIEQLRPTVSPIPVQQRLSAAVTSAAMRSITSRSLQTEEVLALLKQQSLRMAATQSYRTAHPSQLQPRDTTAVPISTAQLQPQARAEPAVILATESLAKYQPSDLKVDQSKGVKILTTPQQQQQPPRVVQVPITTAISIPAVHPSTPSPAASQPTTTATPSLPPPASPTDTSTTTAREDP